MSFDFPHASQNQIRRWTRLQNAKFRREEGLFPAEGVKVVEELLRSDWTVEALLVLPEKEPFWRRAVSAAGPVPVYSLERAGWKKISQDKEPEGLMAMVKRNEQPSLPEWIQNDVAGNLLVLHDVSNPQNLGALVRSACWFNFAGLVLGDNCVDWTHPKTVRASMGAIFHIPVVAAGPDGQLALAEIQNKYLLIGSDVREGVLPHPPGRKAALLLGSESHGLPDEFLRQVDERWRIPGGGQAESLSLPQAAAIMMYEMSK